MKIDILTLFPSMFTPLNESIIGKAKARHLLDINVIDIRSFAKDKHRTADDTPYGGGQGMVLKADLIFDAIKSIKSKLQTSKSKINPKSQISNPNTQPKFKIILLTPAGRKLDNAMAKELSKKKHLILICGHYEGIDERVREMVDEEISVGDYVLTGGELPAMVVIDAVSRFIPGVLGHEASAHEESFSAGLLEYPQYTRPADLGGSKVPEILMGGDHKRIARWRRERSLASTFRKRPDLLAKASLDGKDREFLGRLVKGES